MITAVGKKINKEVLNYVKDNHLFGVKQLAVPKTQ